MTLSFSLQFVLVWRRVTSGVDSLVGKGPVLEGLAVADIRQVQKEVMQGVI